MTSGDPCPPLASDAPRSVQGSIRLLACPARGRRRPPAAWGRCAALRRAASAGAAPGRAARRAEPGRGRGSSWHGGGRARPDLDRAPLGTMARAAASTVKGVNLRDKLEGNELDLSLSDLSEVPVKELVSTPPPAAKGLMRSSRRAAKGFMSCPTGSKGFMSPPHGQQRVNGPPKGQ